MGFSRHEYQRGLPFLSPGHLPDSGIEPSSPGLAGRVFTAEPPGQPQVGEYLTHSVVCVLGKEQGDSVSLSRELQGNRL